MEGLKQLALWKRLKKDEKGVTTVEYAIMLALVALVVALSVPGFAAGILNIFTATAGVLVVP